MALANEFFEATWGRIKLWIRELQTDNSRTLVVHELTSGDEHPVQDRGERIRRTTVALLFDEMTGEDLPPLDRFMRFKAAVDSGAEAVFTHPIDGSFMAKVGEFSYRIDENSNIVDASAEFVAVDEIVAIMIPATSGAGGLAGEGAVSAAADDLDIQLALVDLETDVTDDARAAVEAWTSGEDVNTREVVADVADLSDRLADLITGAGMEDDLALFEAYRATIMLGAAIRAAAIAATSETPAVFSIFVASSVPLIPLMARMYGGANAEERARQVEALNDISTPGWLPIGRYVMPVQTTAERAEF